MRYVLSFNVRAEETLSHSDRQETVIPSRKYAQGTFKQPPILVGYKCHHLCFPIVLIPCLCSDFQAGVLGFPKYMAVNGGCLFLVDKVINQTIRHLYQSSILLSLCLSFLHCSWAKCSGRSDIHITSLSALSVGDQCSSLLRMQQSRHFFSLCHLSPFPFYCSATE